jgi:hypothetical protein
MDQNPCSGRNEWRPEEVLREKVGPGHRHLPDQARSSGGRRGDFFCQSQLKKFELRVRRLGPEKPAGKFGLGQ